MFNIMLDALPTEWEGYKLNTDFRVGIQITQASQDRDLNDREKLRVMANLLFVKDYPKDYAKITECVKWYMSGWNHDNHKGKGSDVEVMDFDIDSGRIYSAFLSQYQINLNTASLHWWQFMCLISNLEECAFTRIISIRAKKFTSDMSRDERKRLTEAKQTYALTKEMTEEDKEAEKEATELFLKYIGKS